MLDPVLCTSSSYMGMVKHVLCTWIWKMLRNEMLQHKRLLYWNHVELCIFVHIITYQPLKFWIFICQMFKFLSKTALRVNFVTCLWVDTISMNANAYMVLQKYFRFWVNNFTLNTSPVVSQFLFRAFLLRTLTSLNHQPYLWNNFILVYQMKFIRILSLLKRIFALFFASLFSMDSYTHYWQQCGITQMFAKIIIVVGPIFIY